MKAKALLLVGAAALGAAGCASSSPTETEEALIVGRWAWVESLGGIAGVRLTPESTGVRREIRFRGDGRAELRVDGEPVRTTGYELGIGSGDGLFEGREVVLWEVALLGGWEEQGVAFPHPDTLVLADGCCDGYVWTFSRAGS